MTIAKQGEVHSSRSVEGSRHTSLTKKKGRGERKSGAGGGEKGSLNKTGGRKRKGPRDEETRKKGKKKKTSPQSDRKKKKRGNLEKPLGEKGGRNVIPGNEKKRGGEKNLY